MGYREIRKLKAEEIECRVGTIKTNGCNLLLYKDARVDMKILDETFGITNWQRTHEVINGNLFCNIDIWDDEKKSWVRKQDVGTESYTEKEKGEASDSFKRAGFNIGIGRELYTAPFIWITPKESQEFYDESGKTKTKTTFYVDKIGYDSSGVINKLVIKDNKGIVRYTLGNVTKDIGLDEKTINLHSKFMELVIKTETDIELILSTFKVENSIDLTETQLKQCIKRMEEKLKE